MIGFWIPKHKYQLVDWLLRCYPAEKTKLKRMSKKQLYAIFYNVIKRKDKYGY